MAKNPSGANGARFAGNGGMGEGTLVDARVTMSAAVASCTFHHAGIIMQVFVRFNEG